ncbi:hypothetical protein B0H17DRAFT_953693, partial [Mycena rosella]
VLDDEGRIIAVFVGTPEDPGWPDVIAEVVAVLTEAHEAALTSEAVSASDEHHRRGDFLPFAVGLSHGGGQSRPGILLHSKRLRPIVQRIMKNKSVRRVCGFQSSSFFNFAPKVAGDYIKNLKPIFERDPTLQHNFSNSIFLTVTFNCGPRTATFEHLDFNNRPDGFCAIMCGGQFNHRLGAHLYLKQLRLVVEFPSGATALIPSGTVDHSNTPLQAGETRCSITQYAAGALFRWSGYGFKNGKQLLRERGGAERKAAFDGAPGERAQAGLERFSKVAELAADHASVIATL